MRNLLYKELHLTINKFFFVIPFILSLLFFIPNWFFSIVVMYFFWISVANIYSGYLAQLDYKFISMLPVSKKDVVTSKVYAFIILEMVHVVFAVMFGIIHNLIYGSYNFAMDINPIFFAIMLITIALFNIIFLPSYFKTGYKFGKPLVIGVVVTLIFAGFFETAAMTLPKVRNILETSNNVIQLSVLYLSIVLFTILNYLTLQQSINNYESIK